MIKVGIIGSSGRDVHISMELYIKAINKVEEILEQYEDDIELISGGSSFMDHIAIEIYNKNLNKYKLTLYLPSKIFNHKFNIYNLNKYHYLFSKIINKNTIQEIENCNAKKIIKNGFFARNNEIAKNSNILIALTFGNNNKPNTSGTLYTWKKCMNTKIHINLNEL